MVQPISGNAGVYGVGFPSLNDERQQIERMFLLADKLGLNEEPTNVLSWKEIRALEHAIDQAMNNKEKVVNKLQEFGLKVTETDQDTIAELQRTKSALKRYAGDSRGGRTFTNDPNPPFVDEGGPFRNYIATDSGSKVIGFKRPEQTSETYGNW